MALYPSTSSGRAQRSHGLVFTAELVEVSGRAQRVVYPEFIEGSAAKKFTVTRSTKLYAKTERS